jgi:hypothetical protein
VVVEVLLDGSQYGVLHFCGVEETILTDGVSNAPLQSFCVVVVANAHILFLVYEVEYLLRNSADAVVSVDKPLDGWVADR